ncbi:MAG: hypothetical protein FH756_10885 [Firmicutes bacterium]|nr:hypothetical protein [Bacillota bacterium]
MLKAVKRFIQDEEGFDLSQYATYTAIAIGTLALIWFTYLKPEIENAGESVGGVIEKGYNDIPE